MSNVKKNHEYTVALRISGEDVNLEEISAFLGLKPTVWSPPTAKRKGFLAFAVASKFDDLDSALMRTMDALLSVRDKLFDLRSRFHVMWWCGHFQSSFDGGPTLSPTTLKALAAYEFPIFIDNYFDDDETDPSREIQTT